MTRWLHTQMDGYPESGERVWLWVKERPVRGFFHVHEGQSVRNGRFTDLDRRRVLLVVWWTARSEEECRTPGRPPEQPSKIRENWGEIEKEWADILTVFTAAEIPGSEHGGDILVRVGTDFFAGRYDVNSHGFIDLDGRPLHDVVGWRPRDFPNPREWPGEPD